MRRCVLCYSHHARYSQSPGTMHRNMLSRHTSSPACWSRSSAVHIQCSKGFGGAKQKGDKVGQSKVPARTAEQAADLAEAAANSPKVRPINSKEAARGKVDYVQVKDWADGRAADIGELQVIPDSYTAEAFTVGGGTNTDGPFYQQLAHHAQYLETQGALTIALEPGAKPFLPFESWQYTVPRYRQYLAELATVHEALEEALRLALSPPPSAAATQPPGQPEGEHSTDSASSEGDRSSSSSITSGTGSSTSRGPAAPWDVSGRSAAVSSAYAALNCYGPDCGLWRAAAAAADFAKLIELAIAYHKEHEQQQQQQQQHLQEPTTSHRAQVKLHASQNAVAYGKYLLQLGRSAAAATTAAASAAQSTNGKRSSSIQASEEEEGQRSVLKLMAHAYAIHVQQQCLGTRIGAAATDQLGLMVAGVTALYLDYPPHIEEPVQQLKAVTDAAGKHLDVADKQGVFDELPKALKKATLLLAPLATA